MSHDSHAGSTHVQNAVAERVCEQNRELCKATITNETRQLQTQLSAQRRETALTLNNFSDRLKAQQKTLDGITPKVDTMTDSLARIEGYMSAMSESRDRDFDREWEAARKGTDLSLAEQAAKARERREWVKTIFKFGILPLAALILAAMAGHMGASATAPDKADYQQVIVEVMKQMQEGGEIDGGG